MLFKKGHTINLGRKCSEATKKKMSEARKGFKHTKEAKIKMSKSHSGKNHYNWQGGITSEADKRRSGLQYHWWRKDVLIRDNYTCQKTGETDCVLNVHHIYNIEDSIPLNYDINNGITLSVEAHRAFHRIYGYKYNSQEQIDEFLDGSFF